MSTCLLSDYGATVVKLEPVGKGSPERQSFGSAENYYPLHMAFNRGKKSIQVDLKNKASHPLVEKLVAWSDVVVENFAVGVMDKLGLGYEALKLMNPSVIYCANSGFGPKGPWAERRSFDMMGQGMSGVMVAQGGGPTKGTPVQVLSSNMCDQIGGIMGAAAIMGALVHKATTGEGQRVDTSQLGAIMTLNAFDMMKTLRFDRQTDNGAPPGTGRWDQQFFQCQHGKWICIAWPEQKMWEVLCSFLSFCLLSFFSARPATDNLKLFHWQEGLKILHRTDLCAPTIGSSPEERSKRRTHLYAEVGKSVGEWERDALIEALVGAKVPVSPVYDYADAANEPQMWDNGYLSRLPDGQYTAAVKCRVQ
jgi:crotonobetainyl-CoA:carnitine CoA-transferase CaiB-like acyl-CoA transferase